MRRRYDTDTFVGAVQRIRAAVPGAAITTDLIAGFPAETAAEHNASVDFVREIDFAAAHVFPYSSRPHTTAGLLEDDVEPEIKRERVRTLQRWDRRAQLASVHRSWEACSPSSSSLTESESAGGG